MACTICPDCGTPIVSKIRDPNFSALLSIIPGIGQIYNGELFKGMLFILLDMILLVVAIFLVGMSIVFPIFMPITGYVILICILFWILNIFDAYRGAKNEKV